jgi:flagellar biosynthesis/type III secretory pathway M-ring protein FliF/YscJ
VLQPGTQLSNATVIGIRRFVAAAYPGLNSDRVAVLDGSGTLLGAPVDRSATREARIQRDVQSALDTALGLGVAIVRVNVRSAGSDQSVQSTRVVPHGLLDADTGRETGSENGRRLSKERTARHYAYDTIVEHRTTQADALGRVSVAVFLDAARTDAAQTTAIAALVRAAAGADLDSGDEVVVEAVPFAPKQQNIGVVAGPTPLARAVLPFTAVLLAVALGFTFFPHRMRKRPDAAVAGLRASLDRESPRTAAYVLSSLPPAMRERVLESYGPVRRAFVEACLRDGHR